MITCLCLKTLLFILLHLQHWTLAALLQNNKFKKSDVRALK